MTGIERLRELVDGISPITALCGVTKSSYDRSHIETVGARLRDFLADIADQIEREQGERVSRVRILAVVTKMERHVLGHEGMEDSPVARWARELRGALDAGRDPADERDAIAWVREHGGIAYVKDAWNVRRNLDRQLEKAQAKVERQQRHIESIQSKLSERREHIENIANDVRNQCLAFGVDVSECDDEFDMLHDLNEALSKRLMPDGMEWPRFEDGEPVRCGDEALLFDRPQKVGFIQFFDNGIFLQSDDNDQQFSYGERVKRPAPKVLDADGVEVEVGDDLYTVEGMIKFHVSAIDKKSGRIATEAMFALDKWADPKMYTHRAPILAADGEPLEAGQTVWDVDGHGPLVVRALPSEGEQLVVLDNGGTNFYRYPEKLTHERPDSLDRLAEDIGAMVVAWRSNRDLFDAQEAAAGCIGENTLGAALDDLVRRVKALAGGA